MHLVYHYLYTHLSHYLYLYTAIPSSNPHPAIHLQFVLIGDTGVGKSCILLRFADDTFTDSYMSTIGVDFRFRTVEVDKKTCKLQIWDTAGQEKYRTITSAYYRGADAIVMVYDVTNRDSFKHVNDWLLEVTRYAADDTCKLLVGNKCDLQAARIITTKEGSSFAAELDVDYLETSALDGTNVETAFFHLAKALMARDKNRASQVGAANGAGVRVGGSNGNQPQGGNCC